MRGRIVRNSTSTEVITVSRRIVPLLSTLVLFLMLPLVLKAQDSAGSPGGGITTVNDMVSGVGDDFFTDADAQAITGTGEGDSPEAPAPEGDLGEPQPVEGVEEGTGEGEGEEPPEEEEEPVGEEEEGKGGEPVAAKPGEAAPKPGEEAAADALPEGVVKMKNRAGKEGLFMEPAVFEGFRTSHELINKVSDLFEEPASYESIEMRDRAYQGQEHMYGDFLTGTPESAQRFWADWARTAADALASGETANDPFVALSGTLYDNLMTVSPDAYANLRHKAATDLITEMYQEAAAKQDRNLYHSAGHIAKTLGLPFKATAEMESFFATKGGVPSNEQRLMAENQRLQEQLNGNSVKAAQNAYLEFRAQTSREIEAAMISDAIKPAFESVAEAWAKVEGGDAAFKELIQDRAFNAIKEKIGQDPKFQATISRLDAEVRRAATPQARQAVAERIVAAYANKSKLVLGAIRGDIAKFANEKFQDKSKGVHARREAAQGQRGPKGASAPVNKGLDGGRIKGSKAGTMFDPAVAAREAQELILQS
jgi:hypothetical protein